ncbi:MAG TPA: thioredoxin domain-containing protein [Gemmatimonadales bacterium]|nr:thioredoxin domain-containing protein [Gemmatimonadales bacterium]
MKIALLSLGLLLLAPRALGQGDGYLEARSKGSPTAPVTVFEMSDFQCPYCRRHALETFPAIERRFVATGKVRWIFVNFPLSELHPNAAPAAEFAMCAAKLNRFWPVHDLLFLHQARWAPLKDPGPFFVSLADSAGIPRSEILPCLASGETRSLIRSEAEGAARSGVASTPTFYIQGVGVLRGAAPADVWARLLDSLVAVKEPGGGR